MEKLQLQKREITGKKVRHLRKEGLTPAVVYNAKGESFNVAMKTTDSDWISRNTTSTTILETTLENDSFKTLVKELDINPVTDEINHVSLFRIDESVPMVFTIPFNIIGISPAVKNNLGVLVEVLNSIEVRCKLSDLKSSIDIDISKLENVGQTINVDDIKLPEGMSLINDEQAKATIVTITEVQKVEEVVVAPAEEEAVVEGEAPAEGEETTEETTDQTKKE
jgi:large subunit ribosomal protein L25